jgi:hypothetical protein
MNVVPFYYEVAKGVASDPVARAHAGDAHWVAEIQVSSNQSPLIPPVVVPFPEMPGSLVPLAACKALV